MSIRAKTILVVLVAITLVGVGYFFIFKYKKIIELTTPTVKDTQVITEANLFQPDSLVNYSDWVTYNNEIYGIEIKYPQTWQVTYEGKPTLNETNSFWQENGWIEFGSYRDPFGEGTRFKIEMYDSLESLDKMAARLELLELEDAKDITFLGLKAKVIITNPKDIFSTAEEIILVKNDDRFYKIRMKVSKDYIETAKKIEHTMLTTIKFISLPKTAPIQAEAMPIDTTKWKMYKSGIMEFSLFIPDHWIYKEKLGPGFKRPGYEIWNDRLGQVRFYDTSRHLVLTVTVKDSDLLIDKVFRSMFDDWTEDFNVNNLDGRRSVYVNREGDKPYWGLPYEQYSERYIIKNDRRYYIFEFFSSYQARESIINNSHKIMSTFKIFNKNIDNIFWKRHEDKELGFSMEIPENWEERTKKVFIPVMITKKYKKILGTSSFLGIFDTNLYEGQFSINTLYSSDLDLTNYYPISYWTDWYTFNDLTREENYNGLSAKRLISDYRFNGMGSPQYREILIVKNGTKFYEFQFSASPEDSERSILIWHKIIKSLKFSRGCEDSPMIEIYNKEERKTYPIIEKYIGFGTAGQLFTASDCGMDRFREVSTNTNIEQLSSTIGLNQKPTDELMNILTAFKYRCESRSIPEKECLKWSNTEGISDEEFLKLKPFLNLFNGMSLYYSD